jgi:RNA-directed DNA polymerase
MYDPFDRRNRPTDKWRHIDNPNEELKAVQSAFHRAVLPLYEFPPQVLGGIKGVSIRNNLEFHVRPEVLVTLDLKRCFPSISHRDVYDALRHTLHFSGEVAALVTQLTTFQGRLPQGAPSSSLLANLVLIPLHSEIAQIARFYGLSWSIWVDDIALSGRRAEDAADLVIAAIHRHNYSVSREKIRVSPASVAQSVTGGVLNKKVSAGRHRISRIREEVLELADGADIFSDQLRSIWGKVNHVKFLNPAQGTVLARFAAKHLPEVGKDRVCSKRGFIRPCSSFGKCTRESLRTS